MRARPLIVLLVVLLGGCAGTVAPQSPTATFPFESGVVSACGGIKSALHQAPELEAMLPSSVAGRQLARWSVRGRCALEMVAGKVPGGIDSLVRDFESPSSAPIDVDRIAYAVAGRSDVDADPPYIIFAAARPDDEDEIYLNMLLLLGGADFSDVAAAASLEGFEKRAMGPKDVYAGAPELIAQNEHQRGAPYLYQTDDAMFVLITELESWAQEAFEQIP